MIVLYHCSLCAERRRKKYIRSEKNREWIGGFGCLVCSFKISSFFSINTSLESWFYFSFKGILRIIRILTLWIRWLSDSFVVVFEGVFCFMVLLRALDQIRYFLKGIRTSGFSLLDRFESFASSKRRYCQ